MQSEIDAAYEALENAVSGLKKVETDDKKDDNKGTPSDDKNQTGNKDQSGNQTGSGKNDSAKKDNGSKNNSVQTGDTANVVSTGFVMLAAGSVVAACLRKRRRG